MTTTEPQLSTAGEKYAEFAPELLVHRLDGVFVLTMNRPEQSNAVNEALHHAFARVWDVLAADRDVRAVVVAGAGKAFSAGGDMDLFVRLQTDLDARAEQIAEAKVVFDRVIKFPKPLVSAVAGPAVGLGCSIAMLSDLLVMGEGAFLADPHVAIGLTAGDGGAAMLPLLIGMMKAKEFVLLGDKIKADEAKQLGLANRVVPDADVLDAAMKLAGRLAAMPAQAVRSTKIAMNMHISRAAGGVLEYALSEEFASFDSQEFKDSVSKFRSKA